MKRRFTILTAALALLVSLAIPMGVWGQTREEVVAYTLEPAIGSNNGYANNCDITISGITWNLTGNSTMIPWRIGGKNLSGVDRTLYSKTKISDNITKIEVTHGAASSVTVNSWTVIIASDASFNSVVSTLTPTFTANATTTIQKPTGVDWSNCYYKFVYNVTIGSSNKFIEFTRAKFFKEQSGPAPTTYTVTYHANGGTGTMTDGNSPYTAGATVTVMTNDFTYSGYDFDSFNTAADGSGISYDEGDTFTINANTTLYAQWTSAPVGNLIIDFESAASTYTNWSFTNMTSNASGDITAHGDSHYGTTGGKSTASIATKMKIATPGYLTCYVSKQSTNTTASTWYIQVSSDGTSWTEVASRSATDMNKGEWKEFTADLSSYTNVYVRVYYSGSTAYRNIDDLTLTTTVTPTINAENVEIAYNATSGNISYTINHEPDPAGTLTASVPQNSWLTIGTVGATVPFSCTENPTSAARTETVTLTYTYNTNETVTKEVTVTQAGNPNIVNLISDINATNTYYTIRGTVVAVNARGCVIGDGTGYINFYNGYTAPSVAINDVVTASGSMTSYGHIYQFSNNSPNTATIATAESSNYDGTPAITVITEIPTSTYSSGLHLSDYFQFEGTLTKSSGYYYVSVGEGQINIAYPSTTQQNAMNALENKTVRVKGYFAGINSSNYFSVMMESIEEVASTEPSVTVIPATISAPFGGADGTLAITYDNLPDEFSFDYYFCDADGEELAEDPDWINAEINVEDDVYSVSYTIDANNGEARTAYFKVYTTVNEEEVYAIVTVNQAQYVIDYAVLPFVWEGGPKADFLALNGVSAQGLGSDYASDNSPYLIKLDGTGDYIQVKTNEQPGKVTIGVKMIGGASTSTITIQGSADGETFTDVEKLTISGAQNDELTLETTNAFAANVRYVKMLFTKGSNIGVGPITIAKPAGLEYTLTIEGYGNSDGGYYLIASPVTVDPATVKNADETVSMVLTGEAAANYDLFYFDQAKEKEWINYKGDASTGNSGEFSLVPGKGYLYAHKTGGEFILTGEPYSGTGTIDLVYDDNAIDFKGWNLIGNPFGTNATLDLPYYRLNSDGSALNTSTESSQVLVMEGVFVEATSTIRTATFSPAGKRVSQLSVNVTRNRSAVLDNAIIRFDEGATLSKFQLNPNSTKVYITQDNQDYAVVRAEEMGAMPVNFKAENNGTYTLSVNAEEVSFAYLHLIDNMTGNDVDLLQTPSYSFEAKTTDYASRFKLVFATGDNSNDDTFAFYSNGSFVINNEGNAELQVIDIMGRIVKSESINGCANVNVNGTTGVYMLRLVNGDNVKVQKVVVK